MEPTANALRPHDNRKPPSTPRAGPAPIDALSSWDGPGTSYTVIPRPAAPSPPPAPPALQTEQVEPPEASPALGSLRPAPRPSMSWLLVGGIAAAVLLVALWKAGVLDNTATNPTTREPSPQSPAQAQLTDNLMESTVTVTQEPMEDDLVLPPSFEPALNELPDPAVYDRQISPKADPIRQAAPAMQSVEKPRPAPVAAPSPATAPVPRNAEHKQPARTSQAITKHKARPVPVDAVTITGTKPASPAEPRGTPATTTVGTLIVAVQPWAEVWIDGRKRGITPPLLKLQLPPGLHTVELRNPDLPSYSQKVQISTGQSVTLRHSFQ